MRPTTNTTRFTIGAAFAGWALCHVAAYFIVIGVVGLSGHAGETIDEIPIWLTLAQLVTLWIPFLVFLVWFSESSGSGRPREDYGLFFRPIDLIGFPIGVLGQLVLVQLVYLPLRAAFPDTFDTDSVEQRARDLWDRAHGGWLVALVVLVVIGAPFVEELVYRGLLQQSLQSRLTNSLAVVLSAAFFAAIHWQPIELPGLFAIGLVFGVCFQRTGRLGMSMAAHIAFNAAGLVVASGA